MGEIPSDFPFPLVWLSPRGNSFEPQHRRFAFLFPPSRHGVGCVCWPRYGADGGRLRPAHSDWPKPLGRLLSLLPDGLVRLGGIPESRGRAAPSREIRSDPAKAGAQASAASERDGGSAMSRWHCDWLQQRRRMKRATGVYEHGRDIATARGGTAAAQEIPHRLELHVRKAAEV